MLLLYKAIIFLCKKLLRNYLYGVSYKMIMSLIQGLLHLMVLGFITVYICIHPKGTLINSTITCAGSFYLNIIPSGSSSCQHKVGLKKGLRGVGKLSSACRLQKGKVIVQGE